MRRLLIVDDHAGFRMWAREVLGHEGFDVVGEATDGLSAIDAVHDLHPEVVLLDIQLPDMSGFEVADRIASQTSVVLTSSRSAADYGPAVVRSLAVGFMAKSDLTGAAMAALLDPA
ncbi:MAG TPA: response regulator [Micromonosporaceae bacterium]|jgi:DNA-binding NarL/FixJ family response regulator|nr:response regulator [Micromonosporaceae bacterium]